jgi:hypothetical protein
MSNPAAPQVPAGAQPTGGTGQSRQAGNDSEFEEPNPFGPDAPNVRADDPPGGQTVPEAPPPKPPATPVDYGDFAPDEA